MTTPLSGQLASFAGQLSFTLDDFQQRACQALETGHGVLVCAPTGAGKTVVGEFAVHLALAAGPKCFATCCMRIRLFYTVFRLSSWTRCTFWPTACGVRCGRKSSFTCPTTCGW